MNRTRIKQIQGTAFIVLIIWLLALLQGCASVTRTAPDGSVVRYSRVGNQNISRLGIVDSPNGFQLQLEGQAAINDKFVERITAGVVAGLIGVIK